MASLFTGEISSGVALYSTTARRLVSSVMCPKFAAISNDLKASVTASMTLGETSPSELRLPDFIGNVASCKLSKYFP